MTFLELVNNKCRQNFIILPTFIVLFKIEKNIINPIQYNCLKTKKEFINILKYRHKG